MQGHIGFAAAEVEAMRRTTSAQQTEPRSALATGSTGFPPPLTLDPSIILTGCRVLLSGNVPSRRRSNETRIVATDVRAVFLWAGPNAPIYSRAEQPNAASLGVLCVAYSYSAFAARRQPRPSR